MARVAAHRPPAAPAAHSQVLRRARILRSATELGALHGFDGVQMQDVAKAAGVAIGTVYRYFPSKTHLFVAVMAEEVLFEQPGRRSEGAGSVDDVAELLVRWTHRFTRRPQLAMAMLQSTLASPTTIVEALETDVQVAPLILGRLGIDEPGDEDMSRVRLLLFAWWGIVVARLTGHLTQEQAEDHLRLGAGLILADAGGPA
ncbi:TetR family transcriptional regulator [Actinomadura rudentiformis]|uniref:TetR family transcriptional regulator n=1 Tax=Actinomadura rudentiformis TaxID=359158 RepID=UPI00178C5B46|nr:TetR family transcriptional regulator [Actinomadura rudentiformis]